MKSYFIAPCAVIHSSLIHVNASGERLSSVEKSGRGGGVGGARGTGSKSRMWKEIRSVIKANGRLILIPLSRLHKD